MKVVWRSTNLWAWQRLAGPPRTFAVLGYSFPACPAPSVSPEALRLMPHGLVALPFSRRSRR